MSISLHRHLFETTCLGEGFLHFFGQQTETISVDAFSLLMYYHFEYPLFFPVVCF